MEFIGCIHDFSECRHGSVWFTVYGISRRPESVGLDLADLSDLKNPRYSVVVCFIRPIFRRSEFHGLGGVDGNFHRA